MRQVRHLLKLYEDGQSAKRKKICTVYVFNIIALRLCFDTDTSINLLFFCIACLNCFDTVKCLMEAVYLYLPPYVRAPANKFGEELY